MKTFATFKPVGAFVLALALLGSTDAHAFTNRSRPIEATIESISLENGTIEIAPSKAKTPSVLALTKQTKFIHNSKFVAAGNLKTQTRATVYYRAPFVGKPYVTKIVWVNGD